MAEKGKATSRAFTFTVGRSFLRGAPGVEIVDVPATNPADIDLEMGGNGLADASVVVTSGDTGSRERYVSSGNPEPVDSECVLIYDPASQIFTIERIALRHAHRRAVSPVSAPAAANGHATHTTNGGADDMDVDASTPYSRGTDLSDDEEGLYDPSPQSTARRATSPPLPPPPPRAPAARAPAPAPPAPEPRRAAAPAAGRAGPKPQSLSERLGIKHESEEEESDSSEDEGKGQ
ncbi:hypothetical protein H9P43_004823 [Blastocladiella emersonii ATCC 22665]|nr:hypothetical protein H9P43_004823 [Blastocladiella emersonii ATCC 22665]